MNKYSETLKTIIKQFHTGDFENLESAIWNAEQLLKEYNVKLAYVDKEYKNGLLGCVFYTGDDMWLAEGFLLKEGFIIKENKNEVWITGIKQE